MTRIPFIGNSGTAGSGSGSVETTKIKDDNPIPPPMPAFPALPLLQALGNINRYNLFMLWQAMVQAQE
jgi:hypothetical protein